MLLERNDMYVRQNGATRVMPHHFHASTKYLTAVGDNGWPYFCLITLFKACKGGNQILA